MLPMRPDASGFAGLGGGRDFWLLSAEKHAVSVKGAGGIDLRCAYGLRKKPGFEEVAAELRARDGIRW